MKKQGQSVFAVAGLFFGSVATALLAEDSAFRVPVAFEKLEPGLLSDVDESYRLAMKLEEQPGRPMVFEAEHASRISLHGAERLALLTGAAGGVAVWQLKRIWFNFRTAAPAEYTVWYRCKGRPGYGVSGPFRASIDNGQIIEPKIVPRRTDKQGTWMWVRGNRYKLNAGIHHLQISSNLVFYGACIDRIVWSKDREFKPSDDELGPAETATVAVRVARAISNVIDAEGVRKWRRILSRQALCGGSVSWEYRPEGTTEWQAVTQDDTSAIPTEKPFRLRMTLTASKEGKTPFVDTVRLEYEGEPVRKELTPGVLYEGTPGGGGVITTDIYQARFAPNGRMASLRLFGKELMVPGDAGSAGWWMQFRPRAKGARGTHIPLGRPSLTADGKIARRTDETTQLFEFGRSKITVHLSSFGGKTLDRPGRMSHVFKLSPSLAVERIIEQGSGNVVPRGTQATRTPQIFLKDGSSFIVKPVSPRLPAYVTYPDGPDGAALVEWLDNRENYNTIGISFTLRPGDSPLLAGNVACESPDHAFAGGRPVKVITNSMIPLAASTFTGSGRLILEEMYVPDGSKGERFEKTITLNVRTKEEARHPITWLATPKRPGHYHGQYQLIKDGAVLRSSSFYILYGAETDKAESRPEDFDAFWQRTMAQLTAMPATFKRLKSTERKGQLASRITFKTIDDRGAWGRLTEPKEDGSYPAILELPAVFHHYGGKLSPSRRKGFVTLGCDVMGFDPDMLDPFSSEGRAIYQPWQKSTVSRPEDFWLYYAYCTIARAYDILANHPKVDSRRIYITGLSQGGGLTIAAAGLRPQNAGALSIVPGICRIAWASPSKGRGAWGPRFQVGPDYERMARMAQYFETAHLARNIRSRFVMFIGLLDDHTPPYAAATVFHYVPKRIRERKLIVDPWSHHTGRSDLHTFIPRWVREDSTSR